MKNGEGLMAPSVDGSALVGEPGRTEGMTVARATVGHLDAARELVRAIAMDIGKEVVHHIETMYPNAAAALPSSGKLSVRNTVFNEIMAAIQVSDEGQIVARLNARRVFRRKIKKAYADIRAPVAPATATPQEGTSPATSPQSAATAAIRPPTNTPTPVSADARSHEAPKDSK